MNIIGATRWRSESWPRAGLEMLPPTHTICKGVDSHMVQVRTVPFARTTSTNRAAAEWQHTVEQPPGMDPLSAATTVLKAYTVELAAADDFAPQLRSVRRLVVATGECSLGGAICL